MMPPENADKLMAMWMYTAAKHNGGHHHPHHPNKSGVTPANARPIMLVPAGNGVISRVYGFEKGFQSKGIYVGHSEASTGVNFICP